ncbi:putative butyrophilin subfamily 2 member A3 [Pungitius pungitius]|uniref:putative butyrophilin subfamily 2 member A3 n=1 Tax=Pungitius pungitius TaxID=134920 RepID=UPI002E102291
MTVNMTVTMMTVLSVLRVVGASRVVCPVPLTVAAEGDNVTLPCHLDPEVNAVSLTFDWKRDDLSGWVYIRRDGGRNEADQRPEYKNRTRVDLEGLKRGDLSLIMSSVKRSDSGSYRCFDVERISPCYANLTVDPKRLDSITTVPPTSQDPGAEKKTTDVWRILGPLLAVLGVGAVVTAFLLWRCKVIDICKHIRGRGPNNNEPVTMETGQREPGEDPLGAGEASFKLMVNDDESGKTSNEVH